MLNQPPRTLISPRRRIDILTRLHRLELMNQVVMRMAIAALLIGVANLILWTMMLWFRLM